MICVELRIFQQRRSLAYLLSATIKGLVLPFKREAYIARIRLGAAWCCSTRHSQLDFVHVVIDRFI